MTGGGPVIELPFGEISAPSTSVSGGEEVTFGIRPHDIRLGGDQTVSGADERLALKARINLTEPLGDVTILDLAIRDALVKMILPEEIAAEYSAGQEIDVSFAAGDGHLFMRETGTRVA